jgi:hypothetical protein
MTTHFPNQQPVFYGHPTLPQQHKDAPAYPTDPSLMYYYQPYAYHHAGVTPMEYPSSQDNARKRQRRQTAGAFMQNMFIGRKKPSTAKPRPIITVQPFGIGPVRDFNENDVLAGRGGRINAHKGNVQYREIVATRKQEYLAKTTKKLEKAHIAASIVRQIRNMTPPGRFLKEQNDGSWWDVSDAKAIKKVCKTSLRHEATRSEEIKE